MSAVHLEGSSPSGLAEMVAGLVRGNLAADRARERLLASARGAVEIRVPDAGVVVGLKYVPGALTVSSEPVPGADVRIRAASDVVLSLSTVPLRFGLPDVTTAAGRAVVRRVLAGDLRVRLRPSGLRLLRITNRLLSVALPE